MIIHINFKLSTFKFSIITQFNDFDILLIKSVLWGICYKILLKKMQGLENIHI